MAGHSRTGSGIRLSVPEGTYEHGTNAKYNLELCRCELCTEARRSYENGRRLAARYGRTAMVDASPARAHVRELQRKGMGLKRIAKEAGVGGGVMTGLLYGRKERGTPPCRLIRRTTAEKLLGVSFKATTATQVLHGEPVFAAWEMIADLMELGWSKRAIAKAVIGPTAHALQLTFSGMEARHVAAIRAIHKAARVRPAETSSQKGALTRARRYSEKLRAQIAHERAEYKEAVRLQRRREQARDDSIDKKLAKRAEKANQRKALETREVAA